MSEKSRKELIRVNEDLRNRFKVLSEKCVELLSQRETLLEMLRNSRSHNEKLIRWLKQSNEESKNLRANHLN